MFQNTTQGLVDPGVAATVLPDVNWSIATGSANAILAAYSPVNKSLTDGLILSVRALATNTTNAPTFAPDGLPPHPITKLGGAALAAGDIAGNLAELLLRYNLANTRWELLNPASSGSPGRSWGAATGTGDAQVVSLAPALLSLADGQLVGFRAVGPNTVPNPSLTVNGLLTGTITKLGGGALALGDIPAANAEVLVRYNLANTRWELLNPAAQVVPWAVGTGTAQAHLVTLNTSTTLYDGQLISFRAVAANTAAAPTIAVNGGTALTIVKRFATALAAGDIVLGGEYTLRYNLANTRWVLLNPVVN